MQRHIFKALLGLASLAAYTSAQSTSLVDVLNQNGYTNFSSLLHNSSIFNNIQGRTDLTILALNNSAFSGNDFGNPLSYVAGGALSAAYYILDGRYESFSKFPNYSYINTLYEDDAGVPQILAFSNNYTYLGKNYSTFTGGLEKGVILNTSTPLVNDPNLPVIWPLYYNFAEDILVPPQDINSTLSYLHDTYFLPIDTNITALESSTAGAVNPPGTLSWANFTLIHALQRTNLLETIAALPNVTVFAPADEAFDAAAAGPGGINSLSDDALKNILEGHVVNQSIYIVPEFDAGIPFSVTALNGDVLDITFQPAFNNYTMMAYNRSYVNNAYIELVDILLPNGVIQVIDQVLYPNVTSAPPAASTTGYVALPSASQGYIGSELVYTSSTSRYTTATSRASVASSNGAATSAMATSTAGAAGTATATSSTVPTYTGAAALPKKNVGAAAAAAAVIGFGAAVAGIL